MWAGGLADAALQPLGPPGQGGGGTGADGVELRLGQELGQDGLDVPPVGEVSDRVKAKEAGNKVDAGLQKSSRRQVSVASRS